MKRTNFVPLAVLCLLATPWAMAQQRQEQEQEQRQQQQTPPPQQPQLHEEVTVRWWLVPVYAIDKTGGPVLNLTPDDLEVYIKNIKVESFSLIKKQFRVTETKNTVVTTPQPRPPAQKKMVFLVFDTIFTEYLLMSKAKEIADSVLAESDKSAQYVVLSIEPYAGLHYIFGPSSDLVLVAKNLNKYVTGKKFEMVRFGSLYDQLRMGGARALSEPGGGGSGSVNLKHSAASFISALLTLNIVLKNFNEFSKVVYLYSSGIPGDALLDKGQINEQGTEPKDAQGQGPRGTYTYFWPDSLAYNGLTTIGQSLNKSGALLFIVDPEGTRMEKSESDSGEQSLRMLATESGGRYFEGTDKEIVLEVNSMEAGYYEISFPDKPEYEGQEMSFEIRSKNPGVQVFTVKSVGREKSFVQMTELEKEVLILNVLRKGPYAEMINKVIYIEGQASLDHDSLVCRLGLPRELARSGWSVFKVRRNLDTGEIHIDRDQIVSDSPTCEIRMAYKGKAFRHDIVLVHAKTGTILVWK